MSQPVDNLVDGAVFFNKGIGLGNIRFGLVVVIIGNKVFDGVIREKSLELLVELGRQCLVMGNEQGRAIGSRYYISQAERFS